jgi:RecB family endonuclease NucS
MLFEIIKTPSGFAVSSSSLGAKPPSSVGLLERDIENWLANEPNLLLPNEQLLVIGRSLAGQAMADIVALDALGRLVIVEIKRD